MPKIITTHEGEKQEHQLEDKPGGFTVIIHDQGLKVDVPEFVEINPRNTIDTMGKMTQKQWDWISTGELFKTLWGMSFDKNHRSGEQKIPATIQELNESDLGLVHVAGMIVMGCEAMFGGQSIFFRNPETYLHPSSERMIMCMFKRMLEICGATGVVTAVKEDPPKIKKGKGKKKKEPEEKIPEPNPEQDREQTLKWLHCMEPEKQLAKVGEQVYTVTDMILEVTQSSPVGQQFIQLFVAKRDGKAA